MLRRAPDDDIELEQSLSTTRNLYSTGMRGELFILPNLALPGRLLCISTKCWQYWQYWEYWEYCCIEMGEGCLSLITKLF